MLKSTEAANGETPAKSAPSADRQQVKESNLPCKVNRVRFFRNGDRFYSGLTIPISSRRYKSLKSLTDELTQLLKNAVQLPGTVRIIYTMDGKMISTLNELAEGQSYVCACKHERFQKIDYNSCPQPSSKLSVSNERNKGVSRPHRVPLKNDKGDANDDVETGVKQDKPKQKLSETATVRPRIITLIRNGTKPRKINRLLLSKRNSSSFNEVLSAIRSVMPLGAGNVHKVFTMFGEQVVKLSDFFERDDVFFVYGTERVKYWDDFKLEPEEISVIYKECRNMPNLNIASDKSKQTVRTRDKGLSSTNCYKNCQNALKKNKIDTVIDPTKLPSEIREHYSIGEIIGKGSFAVVVKIKELITELPYALKVIDKRKCKGNRHLIDAELRILKKLHHPDIVALHMDIDYQGIRYLLLEYVSGGNLSDALSRVSRFSENESRLMMGYLASALEYLHSMSIVHRDIKPQNLILELDEASNVKNLKLTDFNLAREVSRPLHTCCGTPSYVAPEILSKTGYGLKVDVWSAGVVLFIMICGAPPFISRHKNVKKLFEAIRVGQYQFPESVNISSGARDLIGNMLEHDPDIRFTSADVINHYWTKNDDQSNSSRDRK